MKKIIFLLIISLSLLSFAACKGDDGKITLVLDYTPNTNHTGIYVAQALGYYEEYGITLEIFQPPESGAPILVASGNADFGISFQDDLAAAYGLDEPLNITTISTIVNHNTSGFIYNSNSEIASPKDFEGKKVIVWDTPIITEIVKTLVLEDGGNPDNVELIYNNVSDTRQLLKEPNTIVWGFVAWDLVKLEQSGLELDFMELGEINPVFDYYTPVIIVNDRFLANNPEVVENFLKATSKGYEYAINNPTESATILLEAVPELDEALVVEGLQYLSGQYKANAPYWGYIDDDRWTSFYRWVYNNNLVDNEISDDTFTNDFLPKE